MRTRLIQFVSVGIILLLSFSIASTSVHAASGKPVLKEGMSGSAVKTLQSNLKKLGFFSPAPTGYYGSATVSAVKKFQKKYNIPATGVVATLTHNKLDALLKPPAAKKAPAKSAQPKSPQKPAGMKMGSTGKEVLKLQNDLKLLGYIKVAPTGNFGSITEAALTQFQKYYGLNSSGVADPTTLSVINRLLTQTDSSSRGDGDRGEENRGETNPQDAKTQTANKPLYEVKRQWVAGLPQAPFLKGVGKYEGVVIHFTDNMKDTAQLEANYVKVNWRRAFVHEFIDPKEIIQVADPDYKAWGAGGKANDRFIHLELCHADSRSDFDASYDRITQRAAEYLYRLRLGVSPAKADGTGTLWGHMDVSRYLGGTNHTDPVAYLLSWGVTWNDVIRSVTEKYNSLASGESAGAKEAPAENPGVGGTAAESPGIGEAPIDNTNPEEAAEEKTDATDAEEAAAETPDTGEAPIENTPQ